jgi:hypothetical protein
MRDALRLDGAIRATAWPLGTPARAERWWAWWALDPAGLGGLATAAPGSTAQRLAAALLVGRDYRLPDAERPRFADALAGAARRSAGPLRRIDQTDPAEYDSVAQARLWGGSTCSAAALTMVLRAQGKAVRIADVLREMAGGITVERGLVSRPALVRAAARFGLEARDEPMSYEALRRATAGGQPVLVDITNAQFPEGHWIVVTAADADGVRIADSSGYRLTRLGRDEFVRAWSGRGIRILNAALPGSGYSGERGA